jgi:hypothetical protein
MGLKPEQMYEVQEYKGIKLTLPLSDENRKYLYSRGKDPMVAELDRQWENYQYRVQALKDAGEWEEDEESEEVEEAPPYEQWKKAELIDEVNERNAGREDDDKIDSSGTKDELVARLYADDEEIADASA